MGSLRPICKRIAVLLPALPGLRLPRPEPSERSLWEQEARELGLFLRRQDGMALPLAIGILAVLAMMVTAVADYTFANTRNASNSTAGQLAYTAAESGLNDALSALY